MTPLQFKSIRAKLGLSQADFGKLIGRCRQHIARYEAGYPIPGHLSEYTMPLKIKGFKKLYTAVRKDC